MTGFFLQYVAPFVHFVELTGLSLGTLLLCAAVAYFWPPGRMIAVQIGVVVIAVYFSSLYFHRQGRDEVMKAWTAANQYAAEQAAARDKEIEEDTKRRVAQETADIAKRADELQKQVDEYAKQLAKRKGGACRIGVADLKRLRHIR